jgi:hypothetical protein
MYLPRSGALMNPELSHPDLYRSGNGDSVLLLGMTCAQCGHVAFPRQHYGCEKCGAVGDALRDVELDSTGTLASYATVHMHQAKTIAAPFVIGEICLDAGPTVRATMAEATDADMEIGSRVAGRLFPAPSSADSPSNKVELRFGLLEVRS